jgi:putative cell wall-binding protein
VAVETFNAAVPAVFVATGQAFPDALAAGPAAIKTRGPVLLTMGSSLPQATRDALEELRPAKIYVLGGTGAISSGVQSQLQAYTAQPVVRLAGATRYETAAKVSSHFFGSSVPSVYLARGDDFRDALAAVSPAGRAGSPLLLVGRNSLPDVVADELRRMWPPRTYLAGGPGAIGDAVPRAIVSLLGKP